MKYSKIMKGKVKF